MISKYKLLYNILKLKSVYYIACIWNVCSSVKAMFILTDLLIFFIFLYCVLSNIKLPFTTSLCSNLLMMLELSNHWADNSIQYLKKQSLKDIIRSRLEGNSRRFEQNLETVIGMFHELIHYWVSSYHILEYRWYFTY